MENLLRVDEEQREMTRNEGNLVSSGRSGRMKTELPEMQMFCSQTSGACQNHGQG
ncbi:hypothetical protein HUG15_17165 [Salicibibacter cibarius]|uniref:Uncharacterized protein n=1 Tax=Salicibibacter cibarius TaxID=2743000 RepID=A0A7T7CCP7_9BACI|nr:hypothetical protein [Salicibibacter cibarius]QQK77135.1 hypothetical protein HUG15_17165 [Salicibibacter cibarius]